MKILLFFVVPFCVLLLVSAGIRVSTWGIDHTIVVHGSSRWVPGRPTALRIALIDDVAGFLVPSHVSATLIRGEMRHPLFDGEVVESGYAVSRNFVVPDIAVGDAVLELSVRFGKKSRRIHKPIDIVRTLPPEDLQYPSDAKRLGVPKQVRAGGATLSLYTEDRGLAGGLEGRVYVLTQTETGAPISVPYGIQMPSFSREEKSTQVTGITNEDGLDTIMIRAHDLHYPMRVMALEPQTTQHDSDSETRADTDSETALARDSSADAAASRDVSSSDRFVHPRVVYSGIEAWASRPVVDHGEKTIVHIRSMSNNTPLYVDFFHDRQWIQTVSTWADAKGHASLEVGFPMTGLVRIQVSASVINPTSDIVVRHIFLRQPGQTRRDEDSVLSMLSDTHLHPWAKEVRHGIQKEGKSPTEAALRFALSQMYRGYASLPRLVSSRVEDDVALADYKKTFQYGLMISITALGVAMAILIALVALKTVSGRRALMRQVMEDDTDTGVDAEDDPAGLPISSAIGKRGHLLEIAVLFLVIIAAFVAIALLVATLSWN